MSLTHRLLRVRVGTNDVRVLSMAHNQRRPMRIDVKRHHNIKLHLDQLHRPMPRSQQYVDLRATRCVLHRVHQRHARCSVCLAACEQFLRSSKRRAASCRSRSGDQRAESMSDRDARSILAGVD